MGQDVLDMPVVEKLAMRLWWEREARLPRFVRRAPDAIDVATGVWGVVVRHAARQVDAKQEGRS